MSRTNLDLSVEKVSAHLTSHRSQQKEPQLYWVVTGTQSNLEDLKREFEKNNFNVFVVSLKENLSFLKKAEMRTPRVGEQSKIVLMSMFCTMQGWRWLRTKINLLVYSSGIEEQEYNQMIGRIKRAETESKLEKSWSAPTRKEHDYESKNPT